MVGLADAAFVGLTYHLGLRCRVQLLPVEKSYSLLRKHSQNGASELFVLIARLQRKGQLHQV